MDKSIKKINIKVEDNAMSKPLAAEANVIAKTTSADERGLWTTSVIVPLSFLSGTFYSIDKLPNFLKILSNYNPFFHMIDGFRYSFIGQLDGSVTFGIAMLTFLSFVITYFAYFLVHKGYKIKS